MGGLREVARGSQFLLVEVFGGRTERVHQVVGGIDSGERLEQRGRIEHVPPHQVRGLRHPRDERRWSGCRPQTLRIPHHQAEGTAGGLQRSDQTSPDVAGPSGEQNEVATLHDTSLTAISAIPARVCRKGVFLALELGYSSVMASDMAGGIERGDRDAVESADRAAIAGRDSALGQGSASRRDKAAFRAAYLPFAALALLALLWGYNWVVMKVAMQYAEPFTFAALRTFVGAVFMFALGGGASPSVAPGGAGTDDGVRPPANGRFRRACHVGGPHRRRRQDIRPCLHHALLASAPRLAAPGGTGAGLPMGLSRSCVRRPGVRSGPVEHERASEPACSL